MKISNETTTFLRHFEHYPRSTFKQIQDWYLGLCRRLRFNSSEQEIKHNGWNVYEKKDRSFESVFKECEDLGYVVSSPGSENLLYNISSAGKTFLFNLYSHNASADYRQYAEQLNLAMVQTGKVPYNDMLVAKLFYRNEPIQKVIAEYDDYLSEVRETNTFHQDLLAAMETPFEADHYMFHILPRLFLPKELMAYDTTLSVEIEGFDTPENLITTRPYPNQRYVVGGLQLGRLKTSSGFYAIRLPEDYFPSSVQVILRWVVGEKIHYNHHLDITFNSSGFGNLFSTYQQLSIVSSVPELDLTSHFTSDSTFWQGRDYNWLSRFIDDKLQITCHEKVTLIRFPHELQNRSFCHFDSSKLRAKV